MSTMLTRTGARQAWTAVRALIVLTVVTVLYTLVVTAIGQGAMPARANGSLLGSGGGAVGSRLVGQSFTTARGVALPQWFQSRPSAAGAGYDGAASSASNLGPNAPALVRSIAARRAAIAKADGVAPSAVPAGAGAGRGTGVRPRPPPPHGPPPGGAGG